LFKDLSELSRFYLLLHPRITVLVVTRCPNGRSNIMPVSWVTPLSEEPPTLGIAIDRESYTFECLEYCNEFTVNIPPHDKADLVYALGTISGRSVDKVREFNIKLLRGKNVSADVWSDALGIIECKIINKIDVGEVRFYIGEVVSAYAKSEYMTQSGWNFMRTNVLLHGWGRTFYLVGKRVIAKKK